MAAGIFRAGKRTCPSCGKCASGGTPGERRRIEEEEASACLAERATVGVMSARQGARAIEEYDQRRAGTSTRCRPRLSRRCGGSACLRRDDRGVVRPTKGGSEAAAAPWQQAPHRLSARDRVAGARSQERLLGISSGPNCFRRNRFRMAYDWPGDGVGTSGLEITWEFCTWRRGRARSKWMRLCGVCSKPGRRREPEQWLAVVQQGSGARRG